MSRQRFFHQPRQFQFAFALATSIAFPPLPRGGLDGEVAGPALAWLKLCVEAVLQNRRWLVLHLLETDRSDQACLFEQAVDEAERYLAHLNDDHSESDEDSEWTHGEPS